MQEEQKKQEELKMQEEQKKLEEQKRQEQLGNPVINQPNDAGVNPQVIENDVDKDN